LEKKRIEKNEVVFEKIQVRINRSPFPFLSFPFPREGKENSNSKG